MAKSEWGNRCELVLQVRKSPFQSVIPFAASLRSKANEALVRIFFFKLETFNWKSLIIFEGNFFLFLCHKFTFLMSKHCNHFTDASIYWQSLYLGCKLQRYQDFSNRLFSQGCKWKFAWSFRTFKASRIVYTSKRKRARAREMQQRRYFLQNQAMDLKTWGEHFRN